MRILAVLSALGLSACVSAPVNEVPQRRALQAESTIQGASMNTFASTPAARPQRSNADIARDFIDLSFRMESGREITTFTRFETPIRVAMAGAVPASAPREVAALVGRLRSEAQIDIAQTADRASANVIVEFLPRSTLQAVVPQAACFVVPRVRSWDEFRAARNTARIDWTTLQTRDSIIAFVPADVAPQEIRDCLHEELAQSLGPLNDLYHLSDSVFNDDNFHTVLTGFDMLVLRATYAPELRSGMSRSEVAARLPSILARMNPGGQGAGSRMMGDTPRAWITAIETALGPRTPDSARRAAAERALNIAQSLGWSDNRRAFSHFALARLSLAREVESSVMHFAEAARYYRTLPGSGVHVAHVDMQMAAFALSSGQFEEALKLADRAIGPVQAAQNAALLSTLKMIRAEALTALGRDAEASATRLDSLGWARYGFGSEAQVRGRMNEISALSPGRSGFRG